MQDHDYIIFGASSASCVLASQFSEDMDASVLNAEAGGADNNVVYRWLAGFAGWPRHRPVVPVHRPTSPGNVSKWLSDFA